jgi:hypothetical protein
MIVKMPGPHFCQQMKHQCQRGSTAGQRQPSGELSASWPRSLALGV